MSQATRPKSEQFGVGLRKRARRGGFTLIELLITILIIGILSSLFFGALQRAGAVSKIVHTKSTIGKLNASLMDRWDSYRTRRLPLDPKFVLASIKASGGGAYPYVQSQITTMSARRISSYAAQGITINGSPIVAYPGTPYEPLSVPYTAPLNLYSNADQVAAVRLLAIRETMKFEMPNTFADFIGNFVSATSAGGYTLRSPNVLTVAPPLANSYLAAVNRSSVGDPNASPPRPPASFAQIQANQSAECLYLILTVGSTDSGLFGEQLPTADVGDVDGDGLLEFQDAWPVMLNSYSPRGKANAPIDFLRWAPGFISDLQPDQTAQGFAKFSLSHHDYFDPLKLDVPDASPTSPRGFALTPLIYSAGPGGVWGLKEFENLDDPYYVDPSGVMAGSVDTVGGSKFDDITDNVTNHELDTRSGK